MNCFYFLGLFHATTHRLYRVGHKNVSDEVVFDPLPLIISWFGLVDKNNFWLPFFAHPEFYFNHIF